jgi:predicted nucleic acid-binding protein
MPILVDTNILVRLCDRDDPNHVACKEALEKLALNGGDPVICAQVLIEFWSVATRPREANGIGLKPTEADLYIEQTMRSFPCLLEPPDVAVRWRNIVIRYSVISKQAHDARLAAVMEAHDIGELLTLNSAHFARFSSIHCMSPAQVVASSSKG